jgi:hypothetical protein
MPKAVVVITRINGDNEYHDNFKLEGSSHKVEGYPIHFFDGKEFCVLNEVTKPIKENILANINKSLANYFENDEEFYVCYHPGHGTFSITEELKELDKVAEVIKYSSQGNPEITSGQIKELLLEPDPGLEINDIIDSVFRIKLQQKLNLLHECLTQEGAENAANSLENGTDYQKIKDDVNNVKNDNDDLVINLLAEEGRDNFSKDYINQLTQLRDALLNP